MSEHDGSTLPSHITPSSFSPTKDAPKGDVRPASPTSPPYSPITPTMSHPLPVSANASATGQHAYPSAAPAKPPNVSVSSKNTEKPADLPHQPDLPQPPPSQPISLSDNPDAIALRAAMSILQLQRQQALRDMKTLEEQKIKASEDPEAFAKGVIDGTIKARSMEGVIPTPKDQPSNNTTTPRNDDNSDDNDSEEEPPTKPSPFGTIPSAQNIVRMPPVNWAKYHIVGESLDKMHEEQRKRPSPGQPLTDEDLRPRERAPEHVIAAPYNPWLDKVGEKPGRTRSGAKKKKG